MKTLALIFALSLTFSAFATEELALSECTKGDDGSRKVSKVSENSDDGVKASSETSSN